MPHLPLLLWKRLPFWTKPALPPLTLSPLLRSCARRQKGPRTWPGSRLSLPSLFCSGALVGAGAFFLLALLLTACPPSAQRRTTPNKPKYTLADYFPLRVGDRRIYRIRYARSQKTVQREVRIVRKKNGAFFDNQNPSESYRIDPYGVRGRRRYLLKYPLRVGTKWISVTSLTSVERYVIVDVSRKVSVPAGTFEHCIVVRSRDSRGKHGVLEALFHFAPNVGLVKITTTLESGQRRLPQWSLELVAYKPASS